MKTSKLFLTSLLAAASTLSVPAFAWTTGADGLPDTSGIIQSTETTIAADHAVTTDTIYNFTDAGVSSSVSVTLSNSADVKLVAPETGSKMAVGSISGEGDVWFAQGRWRYNNGSTFDSTGTIYMQGGQFWVTGKAFTTNNDVVLGSSSFSENIPSLDNAALRVGSNVTFNGTTTVVENAKIGFQGGSTLTIAALAGSGDLSLSAYDGANILRVTSATGASSYIGNVSIGSGTTLYWGNKSGTSVNSTYGFGTGTISVSGGGNFKIHLSDASDRDASTDGKVIVSNKVVLNGTSASTAKLETQDGSYYFSGGIQIGDGENVGHGTFWAHWDKGHVINGLSGSGTFVVSADNLSRDNTTSVSIAGNGGFSGTVEMKYTGTYSTAEFHAADTNSLSGAVVKLTPGSDKTIKFYADAATTNIAGLSGSGNVVAGAVGNKLVITTAEGSNNTFSGNFTSDSSKSVDVSVGGAGTQTLSGSTLANVEVTGGELALGGETTANSITVTGGKIARLDDLSLTATTFALNGGTLVVGTLPEGGSSAWTVNGAVSVSGTIGIELSGVVKNGVYTILSGSSLSAAEGYAFDISGNTTNTGWASSVSVSGGSILLTITGAARDLVWAGADSGATWNTTDSNWTVIGETGTTTFSNNDSVTFNTTTSVSVAAGTVADVVSITGTVDAPTTLTLTNQANLTANSIHIGDNATLALGDFTSGGTVNHKLTGTGTVSLAKTSAQHSLSINIGTEFAGTVDFSGNLEFGGAVLGSSSAKLNLTDVHLWCGSGATKTLGQAITFNGANNKFGGAEISGTLNLTGGVTFSEGAVLTMETGGTLNISGSMAGADISQSGGTLNITLSGDSTIKLLTQTGGTVAVSGTSATFASATISGKLNITNGVTVFDVLNVAATATDEIDVTGGASLTIKSGSILKGLHVKTGTEVNIGDGTNASTLTLARLEMGDNETSGDTLNVRQNATLVITGSDDTTSGNGDYNTGEGSQYKLTGIMFGEWGVTTTANIEGKMLAENASVFSGDNNMTLNVKNGGVLAVKGIGQNKTGKSSTITLDLADNGKLILGSEGITRFGSGTWSASLGAGTIGTSSADGTTISKDMTLTSATGTTFDTQLWNFAADGADITRSADTASSITVNGVISGEGALKKAGAGTLTLRGANTYKGGTTIEGGVLVAGHASALGGGNVTVADGAKLNLGTAAVTVAGLSGAGTVGLADGTTSSTLTVNGGGVFSGRLNRGENSLALVFDAGGQTLELNPTVSNTLSSVEIKAGTVKTGNAFGLGGSQVSVQSAGALEFTASKTNDYGLMLGGITFAAGSSFVVDVTGASENDVLKIITSSTFQYYNGTGNVNLASDNLDSFVNEFVTLNGWNGLADWSYENSVLSVTLTIPEPSVFGLLAGLGALALAGTRRRRKKA